MGLRALTTLAIAGTAVLAACGSATSPGSSLPRVADVVHVGPYTQEFASPLPADAAQASVVEGFREAQVLWEKSENTGRLVAPVRDYVAGPALTHLTSATSADKSRDVVPAGTDRFFQTRVRTLTSRKATITTCDDGSKFEQVNPHTGKVAAAYLPTPGEQYLFETWRMGRLDGHWAITGFSIAALPDRAAEQCQPGVTGLGPSRLPGAAALARQLAAAMRAARSVHIAGTVRQGGSLSGVNLSVTRSGQVFGQVSQGGHTFTVLAVPGRFYLRINAGFLQSAGLPAAACARLCGRYLQYPAAQARQLAGHLSMASLTRSLTRSLAASSAGSVRLLGEVTVNGQLAWLLQDSQENSVYLAATGRPLILRAVSAPPGDDTVTFTDWNAARVPGQPSPRQIVTAAQLAR